LADYDGDGLTDLISGSPCCQRPPRFHVFLRQKDGGFGPRRQVTLGYPEDRYDLEELPYMGLQSRMAVADLNRDGIPDVLIGGNTKLLGVVYGPLAGKDVLTVERVWPKGKEPLRPMTTNPCVADWDGDGLPDLIVGGYTEQRRDYPLEVSAKTRGIYWLRNIGTKREPKFAEPKLLIADENPWSEITGICVADWNDDGRQDLIVSSREIYRTGERSSSTRKHHMWVYLRRTMTARIAQKMLARLVGTWRYQLGGECRMTIDPEGRALIPLALPETAFSSSPFFEVKLEVKDNEVFTNIDLPTGNTRWKLTLSTDQTTLSMKMVQGKARHKIIMVRETSKAN
jgi:hypothetical protein